MQRGPKPYVNEYEDPSVEAEVQGVVALMKLVDRDESISVAAIRRLAGISKEQAELVYNNWGHGRYEVITRQHDKGEVLIRSFQAMALKR